jgi:hypothetical protein
MIKNIWKWILNFSKKDVKHNIFISYANNELHIVENLRDQFEDIGIKAWVYSRDATLGEHMWKEITKKLTEVDMVIFVLSDDSATADGQHRELNLVLDKIVPISGYSRILPLFITGTNPKNYPAPLRSINGDFLDGRTVKLVAWKIANQAFPSLIKKKNHQAWNYPVPGEWLEVSNLDGIVAQYFDIDDKLYFRAISPMGLFECYDPKTEDLFWISPNNVQRSLIEGVDALTVSVPKIYTVNGIVEIQALGWTAWNAHRKSNK